VLGDIDQSFPRELKGNTACIGHQRPPGFSTDAAGRVTGAQRLLRSSDRGDAEDFLPELDDGRFGSDVRVGYF
jgi:hypothetical protein